MDYQKLTSAFALRGRITLMGSDPVVAAADRALKFVVDLAIGPPRDAAEVRRMMDDRNAETITDLPSAAEPVTAARPGTSPRTWTASEAPRSRDSTFLRHGPP